MRKRIVLPILLLFAFAMLLGCHYSVQGGLGLNLFVAGRVPATELEDENLHEPDCDCCGEHLLADLDSIGPEIPIKTAPPSSSEPSTERSEISQASVSCPVTSGSDPFLEKEEVPRTTTRSETQIPQETKENQPVQTKTSSTSPKPTTTNKVKTTSKASSQATTTKASQSTKASQTTQAKVQGSYYENYEAEVIRLVNAERAKEGLAPLRLDSSLRSSARIRAKEIVSCWGHTRPNGQRFCTAIKSSYCKAAENIAAGQSTPERVVQSWMGSASHRANIMNPALKLIGVGCYYDTSAPYKIYWAQLFINP
ncbi:MAG TPA: CAP domain-containing protein [Clostridia bacterium]|nr:CAP domain-containing protein [Clostridia bacterium]